MQKDLRKEPLSERVVRLRKSLGLNQLELASRSGLSDTTIQKIEVGQQKDIKVQNAIALAEALEVSLEYLAYGEDHLTLDQAKVMALMRLLDSGSIRALLATAQALCDMRPAVDQKKVRS